MQCLRQARLLARLALAWLVLSIGVAVASPLVNPQGMQLVCSGAGTMKLVVAPAAGGDPAPNASLDCPLCAVTGAPPAELLRTPVLPRGLTHACWTAVAATQATLTRAPLPARGPPATA